MLQDTPRQKNDIKHEANEDQAHEALKSEHVFLLVKAVKPSVPSTNPATTNEDKVIFYVIIF